MLKQVLKKDLCSTARSFLPLILGFVVVSVLAKILFEIGFMGALSSDSYVSAVNEVIVISSVIFLMVYILYMVILYIMTYVFLVSDFYKTMVGEQAYLTHTLPVKARTLIHSKIIIACFWQLVMGFFILLSLLLLATGHFPEITWNSVRLILQNFDLEFSRLLGMSLMEYAFFMILALLIEMISSPLMFYVSIALGHLFGKHKILGAILSYLGIYTVMQIIMTVAMVGFGYTFTKAMNAAESVSGNLGGFFAPTMWFGIFFSIVATVIFYFITTYVMGRKLNLE